MTNVIPYQPPAAPAVSTWRGVQPGDFDSAILMAQAIALSGMAPKSYYPDREPDPERRQKIATAAVFSAMQLGAEIGLSPMTAVRSIAVINGLPGLYGPAMLGVVEASGKLVDIDEGVEGEGLERHAWCTVQRVGRKPRTFKFSMADAKQARLIGKVGPWTEYPDRMLLARARTFALRDVFPDVLLGLAYSVEELADIPAEQASDQAKLGRCDVTPPKVEPVPEKPKTSTPSVSTFSVNVPYGGEPAVYPRTRGGAKEAFAEITKIYAEGHPDIIGLNNAILDEIAERVPVLAAEVSELRAAAAEALKPKDEDEDQSLTSESDGFVARFVNGDDPDPEDFPGDRPSAGS